MDAKDFARQLEKLAVLDEPLRRRLYLHVVSAGGEVGREAAARAVDVSVTLAAFHLDRLVEAGLLEASFRRLSGRAGPGAGRPAKLYRRAATQLDVSVPQRRYELAAQLLTRALAENKTDAAMDSLRGAARERGAQLAGDPAMRAEAGAPLQRAAHALAVCGFEPAETPEHEIVLRNCPFDSLRADCKEAICGMNLALIEGLLAGLSLDEVEARLAPQPGLCCVALRRR